MVYKKDHLRAKLITFFLVCLGFVSAAAQMVRKPHA